MARKCVMAHFIMRGKRLQGSEMIAEGFPANRWFPFVELRLLWTFVEKTFFVKGTILEWKSGLELTLLNFNINDFPGTSALIFNSVLFAIIPQRVLFS